MIMEDEHKTPSASAAAVAVQTKMNAGMHAAVKAAVDQGLIRGVQTDDDVIDGHLPFAVFYDADAFISNLAACREAFPTTSKVEFLHATAVKTNPTSGLMRLGKSQGHGAECASIGEVQHSLRLGFPAAKIIYDSPCKSMGEIKFALVQGVHLNIDNLQELNRVASILAHLQETGTPSTSVIGLRINPLVGAGAVASLSVSTPKSKFGIPCPPHGPERASLIDVIAANSFIRCIHVHTGSGGMTLDQMTRGSAIAVEVAREVNEARSKATATYNTEQGVKVKMIDQIDIGGGLPVTWGKPQSPTFAEYADALRKNVPALFDGEFARVLTEFGAAMHCKFGWVGSVVEVTKPVPSLGRTIVMIHAGSDMFARPCYAPNMRAPHPVWAYNADGTQKVATEKNPATTHDIAGPLCFSGDIVVPGAIVPALSPGDIVVLSEAGGNTLSIRTTHCSRRRPAVYAYFTDPRLSALMSDDAIDASSVVVDPGEEVLFKELCKAQKMEDTLQWL